MAVSQESSAYISRALSCFTSRCGGSSAVFLLIKKCVIIYLYGNNGSFANSPYLDIHGEIDQGHRRHRPQYLHKARYEEVLRHWLKQTIPTVVARKLEAASDSGGWLTM